VNLGRDGFEAQVREDDAHSYEVLAQELEKFGTTEAIGEVERAQFIFGHGAPRLGREPHPEHLTPGYHELNSAQREAVARALGSEITFVWGPPGTGKTEVVSCIVDGCVKQDLRVLFVAPTHYAVDQALGRICDLLRNTSKFDAGLVQRVGDIQVESLREKYESFIVAQQVLSRVTGESNGKIQQVRERQSQLTKQIDARKRLDPMVASLKTKREKRSENDVNLKDANARITHLTNLGNQLQQQIKDAANRTGIFAGRAAKKAVKWQTELAEIVDEITERRTVSSVLKSKIEQLDDEISQLSAEVDDVAIKVGPETLSQLQEKAEQVQHELKQLDDRIKDIKQALAVNCQVAAMTAQRSIRGRIPLQSVDVVVIDEAGMVDLPTAFHLASRATKRIIVAGDFRQLPAIVNGDTDRKASAQERELVRRWVARDAFHAAGVAGPHGIQCDDRRLVRLDTQYRMRPEICEVVNAVAYPDAPLQTGRDDTSSVPPSPMLEAPLVLLDTSDCAVQGASAYRNEVHAALVRELVRFLQHDDVLPTRRADDAEPGKTLAVITPYKEQVRLLDGQLRERFGKAYEGLVDTVHRFQGSERPVIVVDTVTGASGQLGNFFEGNGLQSSTCRLMNVALSRARDHLVIVANVRHLRAKLSPVSEVRVMLDLLERKAQRINIGELVPIRKAEDLKSLSEDDLARPAFFPADETDLAIEWDFTRARTRIEIYCAFLSKSRVVRFRTTLRKQVNQGVRVTVFTRGVDQCPGNVAPIEELKAAGCMVELRDQMHEKVVVIDHVLWHGSLNLFAHTRATELMMRVESAAACENARRVVERAKPTRPRYDNTPPSSNTAESQLIYLNVPFSENDEAKVLGARFDWTRKKWYVDTQQVTMEAFTRWLPR
jgi:superfamily I DNA and/or RNA helicase